MSMALVLAVKKLANSLYYKQQGHRAIRNPVNLMQYPG